ncbi:SLIT-ROBO Rho GTPase-activating protein 3 [Bombyx mori]
MFHCIVQPRHDWGPPDFANAFPDIKSQLVEHTRVLEARAEATAGVAGELHEYCRRRADLEHEYARALDKLARAAHQRHEGQKHKREQWAITGAFSCWQTALDATRSLSRDHAALADLYGGPLAARLQRAADDALRLHRKCRDIVSERHEEVCAALAEAWGAGKAQTAAAHEWRVAAHKLRTAHAARAALAAHSPPRHKKLKALDKELDKRRSRHSAARAHALRARADYVLSLEAANATLQRYFLDDIADIILCMEVGFEAVVGRAVRTLGAAEGGAGRARAGAGEALCGAAAALDALADRRRLLDAHVAAFALPRPLPHQPPPPDRQDEEMREVIGDAAPEQDEHTARVTAELEQRLLQLDAAARQLRAECRENAKTLDAAEAELIKQMEGSDAHWDVSNLFGPGATPLATAAAADDNDAPRRDQEDYYLAKFRAYVSCAGRLARLECKAGVARARLGAGGGAAGAPGTPPSPPRRAAARLRRGQFAAPLEHRLPVVLTSCVRVIASYGLRHQGAFRVSGSQVEMQALRAAFERGEDPLADVRDATDINSVCGLLKLYLRELRPPLLPPQLQERLVRVAAVPDDAEFVRRLRDTLAVLPRPALLVLRYLFAFLAHLAEHSDHNMMDAWNLAICVGPTLLAAAPADGGQQVTAQNLVNELVKRTIIHHLDVFPQDIAPYALYSRFPDASGEDDNKEKEEGEEYDEEEGAECAPDVTSLDEHDAPDDLSLYNDEDDEASDECENGDWSERDSAEFQRPPGAPRRAAAAQTSPAAPAPSPPAAPAARTDTASRLAESTPDLVLDLPSRAAPTAPPAPPALLPVEPPSVPPAAAPAVTPGADPADTFVHNRDTLKKRPQHKQSKSEGGTEEPAGGSPVPARNTARVAAKFADLTLTGGSLKPALAAKPALLRRPPAAASAPAPAPAPAPAAAPAPAPH